MTRVLVTVLLLCQPFCLAVDQIPFAESGLAGPRAAGRPAIYVVHRAGATQAFDPQPEIVAGMVDRGVMALTGQTTRRAAWSTLVSTQDVVGVKVHSAPGPVSGTRPSVAAAVVRGLLDAGVPPSNVIIWDRRLEDLRIAKYVELARSLGVRVAGAQEGGYDPQDPYESPFLGQLVYGDLEFRRPETVTNQVAGRNSYFSRLLTKEITRLINIAPLLNHNEAGVSGILYTLASASTDNFLRFEKNSSLIAEAVPDIYKRLADRVALNILDALVGQYEGRQSSKLQYSEALDEIWMSTDPVALDVFAMRELDRIRQIPSATNRTELYYNAHYFLGLGENDLQSVDINRVE